MRPPSFKPVTKRRFIFEQLLEEFRSGRYAPGDRVETTEALARKFGTSALTVHGALRDLVHEGLLVRHQGKGTFVADWPEGEKRVLSSSLAIVLPKQDDIIAAGANDYMMTLLQGATTESQENGARLSVYIVPSHFSGRMEILSAADQLMSYDGAIFVGDQYRELMDELMLRKKPICLIDGEQAKASVYIGFDREKAIAAGLNHLIQNGRKRIGYFGAISSHGELKRIVYQRTMKKAGLPFDPALMCQAPLQPVPHAEICDYISNVRPDGVFIDNFPNAELVAGVATNMGLQVPEDLAVVGYGVGRFGAGQMMLSFVEVPYYELGARGAGLLNQVIRGELHIPVHKTIASKLWVHDSCGSRKKEPSKGEVFPA